MEVKGKEGKLKNEEVKPQITDSVPLTSKKYEGLNVFRSSCQ
jgi:hypothetical protein